MNGTGARNELAQFLFPMKKTMSFTACVLRGDIVERRLVLRRLVFGSGISKVGRTACMALFPSRALVPAAHAATQCDNTSGCLKLQAFTCLSFHVGELWWRAMSSDHYSM